MTCLLPLLNKCYNILIWILYPRQSTSKSSDDIVKLSDGQHLDQSMTKSSRRLKIAYLYIYMQNA